MCTSPLCPNGCQPAGNTGRAKRLHMLRTYIRVYDAKRKLHAVPVGWWCPGCHAFMDDLQE